MTTPVTCSYLTHRGYLRSGNEDSMLIAGTVISGVTMESPITTGIAELPALFCVADGVGGAVHGEIASRTVLESFSRSPDILFTPDDMVALVIRAKEILDGMVLRDAAFTGFGTTVAGIILFSDRFIVYNCGDSRVYRIDRGGIERISHDHSLVQELCDQGMITPEQVYTHPYRNIITSVVSGDLHRPAPPVMTASFPVTGSERILLCTDGVWEMIRDPDLAEICSLKDLGQAAATILARCLERGGPDNISLILVGR